MINKNNTRLFDKIFKYEFVRYVFIGGIITLIDWISFYILAKQLNLYYQLSLVIGFSIASSCQYILIKYFAFRCKSKKIVQQFSIFITIVITSLLLNMGVMYVLVDIILMEKMISRIITTIVMLFINYAMNKNITFNKKIFRQN